MLYTRAGQGGRRAAVSLRRLRLGQFVVKRANRRGCCHTPAHENKGRGPVNGDEVRNARFRSGDGYDASHVDDLLRRVAEELDAERPVGPLIAGAAFPGRVRGGSRRYEIAAVDWFLDQLLRCEDLPSARMSADPWRDLAVVNHFTRSGPGGLAERTADPSAGALWDYAVLDGMYLAEECTDAWRGFGQQPGTHLLWAWTGAVRRELQLRTAEQQSIASGRYRGPYGSSTTTTTTTSTISTGGRSFTWRPVTGSSWPDIAGVAARHAQDLQRGRFLDMASLPRWDVRRAEVKPRELVDETGTPILYTSGVHVLQQAYACITFDERRWLWFPVRGTWRTNAIMTAVDQAGNSIARYRLIGGQRRWNRVEITVHAGQQLTDELVLAIAISAPWLSMYFSRPVPAGGGG